MSVLPGVCLRVYMSKEMSGVERTSKPERLSWPFTFSLRSQLASQNAQPDPYPEAIGRSWPILPIHPKLHVLQTDP